MDFISRLLKFLSFSFCMFSSILSTVCITESSLTSLCQSAFFSSCLVNTQELAVFRSGAYTCAPSLELYLLITTYLQSQNNSKICKEFNVDILFFFSNMIGYLRKISLSMVVQIYWVLKCFKNYFFFYTLNQRALTAKQTSSDLFEWFESHSYFILSGGPKWENRHVLLITSRYTTACAVRLTWLVINPHSGFLAPCSSESSAHV